MSPEPRDEATRARLQRQARRDTAPELMIRRALHALGLRYRVDAPLPITARRRADLLFSGARVAVFIDGCFWHQCPTHGSVPLSNRDWWRDKLRANVARDRDTDLRLAEAGWQSVRVWEHEDPLLAASRVASIVRERPTTLRSRERGQTKRSR